MRTKCHANGVCLVNMETVQRRNNGSEKLDFAIRLLVDMFQHELSNCDVRISRNTGWVPHSWLNTCSNSAVRRSRSIPCKSLSNPSRMRKSWAGQYTCSYTAVLGVWYLLEVVFYGYTGRWRVRLLTHKNRRFRG
jgi:hypothetical protein